MALLFSLASYKNLFYQIKRSQNEVLAKQAHWQAEGGLECAFSLFNKKVLSWNQSYPSITNCMGGNKFVNYESNVISSQYIDNNRVIVELTRQIVVPTQVSSGLIKANSDVYIAGSSSIHPDPGIKVYSRDPNQSGDVDLFECVVIRYSNNVNKITLDGNFINNNLHYTYSPSLDFPYKNPEDAAIWPKCKSSHITSYNSGKSDVILKTQTGFNIDSSIKNDFTYDSEIFPFYETFGYQREEWLIVKDIFNKRKGVITNSSPSDCPENIKNAISKENSLIWVTGSCDLSSGFTEINDELNKHNHSGLLLLIQDGILNLNGSSALNALIYYFRTDESSFTPTESLWRNMSGFSAGSSPITQAEMLYTGLLKQGSFSPSGGYIFDAPGITSRLNNSLNLSFNKDIVSNQLSEFKKVKWLEGSWRDF